MIQEETSVLVTGGAGFIGSNLVEHCRKKRCRVRSLDIRQLPSDLEGGGSVRHVVGDIMDSVTIAKAVDGVSLVFHLAGLVTQKGASKADYYRVNVDATRELLETCARAGVRRFVYCSTDSVSGKIHRLPARESDRCFPDNIYGVTKHAAETEVLRFADRMHVTIVRPTRTYGPRDVRMLEIFRRIKSRTFYVVGSGDVQFHPIFIDDLIHGFECCADAQIDSGEIFYIGGEAPLKLKNFLALIADYFAVRLPGLRFPLFPAILGAWLVEMGFSLIGKVPPVTRRNLEFFTRDRAYDISKAKRMLEFSPRVDPSEGIRKTGNWYREMGYL